MKKLGRLQINPEKLMKEGDLIKVSGGAACTCCCYKLPPYNCNFGYLMSEECDCITDCKDLFGPEAWGISLNCNPNWPPCSGY